jgi:protein-disulfide isomerase
MLFFHKPTGLTPIRLLGYVIFFVTFLILGFFAWKTYTYYSAIKRGDSNPLIDTYIGLSLTNALANTEVTPQDLERLAAATSPSFGPATSTLTIVEFLDFSCPFSEASYGPLREVMQKYQDRVRIVYRDFPINEIHPRAFAASLAARCAHEQGKYLAYHDRLFANQDRHEDEDLFRYAKAIGLNEAQFKGCYESQKYTPVIRTDIQDGLRAGVQGTPTFFFNGIKVPGTLNAQLFELLIQRFLKLI